MIAALSSQDASSSPRYAFGLTERQGVGLCVALLAAASFLASFPLACATPFAAFGVVAALMLPLRSALLATVAVWLINQAIGFGLIGYPWSANALNWGVAIGAAALLATVTAEMVLHRRRFHIGVAALIALAASYAVYELALLAASRVLGGEEAYTAEIVTRLGVLNLLWLGGLLGSLEVGRVVMRSHRTSPARA